MIDTGTFVTAFVAAVIFMGLFYVWKLRNPKQ